MDLEAGREKTRRRRASGLAGTFLALALAACAAPAPPPPPAPSPLDSAAAGCSDRPETHPELDRPIRAGAIDPALMDRAIRLYTNAERCAAGQPPVRPEPALARAAALQANAMAAGGYVAPLPPGGAGPDLRERLRRSGVAPYSQRGENLMQITLVTPGVAATYGARACLPPPDGPPPALGPTYRSIARRLVDTWRGTEAYTVSILEPHWTAMGAAVAVAPSAGACGDVYGTQTFVAR